MWPRLYRDSLGRAQSHGAPLTVFEGGPIASLLHLLTQPDHLLILAGAGLAIGIVLHIRRKA